MTKNREDENMTGQMEHRWPVPFSPEDVALKLIRARAPSSEPQTSIPIRQCVELMLEFVKCEIVLAEAAWKALDEYIARAPAPPVIIGTPKSGNPLP